MAIILTASNVKLAKKLCLQYVESRYSTFDSIAKSCSTDTEKLTPINVRNYIHFAITKNIVDDDIANKIRKKAIEHTEKSIGRINHKSRNFYDELFKERAQDKINFPNGHIPREDDEPFKDEVITGVQLSLF